VFYNQVKSQIKFSSPRPEYTCLQASDGGICLSESLVLLLHVTKHRGPRKPQQSGAGTAASDAVFMLPLEKQEINISGSLAIKSSIK